MRKNPGQLLSDNSLTANCLPLACRSLPTTVSKFVFDFMTWGGYIGLVSKDKYNSFTDKQLVEACISGEHLAWEALINRYKGFIFSIPFKYGLTRADAEDIFQDVCLLLVEKLGWLRDSSKISSWLITTTSRECWKLLRKRGRRAPLEDDSPPRWELPAEVVEALEREQMVREAVAQLSPRCQKLIYYLFFRPGRKLSYQRIARMLGVKRGSIAKIRSRCLKKLKKIWQEMSHLPD